ncbi:MAG: S9 family peptidase [Planctomycetota bacterium]
MRELKTRFGLILVGLLTSAGCASSQAMGLEAVALTPEHVAKLRSVSTAKISPDGKLIAYTLRVPRRPFEDEDGPAWAELHVVDAGGNSRPFITGEVDVGAIEWLPDGKAISFITKRGKDEHKSVYVIPIDGGESHRVVSLETDVEGYSWSPDCKEVALLAKPKLEKRGKSRQDKGFKQEIYEEDWRPMRVWIAKPDEKDSKPRLLELPGSASEIHWSSIDRRLALALAPTPLIDDEYMRRKVHVVDIDSGKTLAKFENPGKLGQIVWSPDGKKLAMISAEDIHDTQVGRLLIAPSAGATLVDLLPNYEGHVTSIAWQDNDTIMFLLDEGVWTTFGEVRVDGKDRKTHVPTGKMVAGSFSLSKDGQSAAFTIENPSHPFEVAMMSHGDKGIRKLTDSNPWLNEIRMAAQEIITYKTRDGLQLEGLLIHPPDEQQGTKYPLIMYVHGGPEAHERNGWLTSPSLPGQVAAARGYAVFYPNYRGSTGRGVAFAKMGQADLGGREFDDLVDGVDHLIQIGLVDAKRVGITGGSYGGYATAWCSTFYSNRFAAGVMNVGVSDQISMFGTSDIPEEWYLVHSRKRLWEDWKFFLERSPIYHVGKAKTPLLIMHGKDDPRVDPRQSLELFRNLKTLNQTPVRLVHYPGEGHGNRKAAARYDYNLRMMQWFDHYLKGPGGEPPAYELQYELEPKDSDNQGTKD